MAGNTEDERLLELVEALKNAENPFDSNKVLKAREDIVDVPAIHKQCDKRLNKELEQVREYHVSRGVLISGIAGSGKSHLLARLYRERPKDALFFQVEALPGGTGWLKHILQCMVNDLDQPIGPDDPSPQLVLLIQHFIAGVKANRRADAAVQGHARPSGRELAEALARRQRQIVTSIPDAIASDLLKVMANLYRWQAPPFLRKNPTEAAEKTALASRWLKGTMIEDEELEAIGVTTNLGSDESQGQANFLTALRVFGMLTEGRAPIVLAFDQLDTMEPESIHSLGTQLLHLIGSDAAAPNYLIVTAGVNEEMDEFISNRIITQAVADVIFKTRIELPAIGMKQCKEIVAGRLARVFSERELLPAGADELFPFTAEFIEKELTGHVKPSPRRVLITCAGHFDQLTSEVDLEWLRKWPNVEPLGPGETSTNKPDREAIQDFIDRELNDIVKRLSETTSPVPIDDDILANTIRRLIESCGAQAYLHVVEAPKGPWKKPSDAFFCVSHDSPQHRTVGIAVNNKGHHSALRAALVRSKDFLKECGSNFAVLFLRDANAKSISTWGVCNGLISELENTSQFVFLSVENEHVAFIKGLDELRRSVADLIIPPSPKHAPYQVSLEDFGDFLRHCSRLWNLPLFAKTTQLMEQPQTASADSRASDFVLARIEAAKVRGFEELVIEWAGSCGRSNPILGDNQDIEAAVASLEARGKVLLKGVGSDRAVKKV
jgi:hypothetical protein